MKNEYNTWANTKLCVTICVNANGDATINHRPEFMPTFEEYQISFNTKNKEYAVRRIGEEFYSYVEDLLNDAVNDLNKEEEE